MSEFLQTFETALQSRTFAAAVLGAIGGLVLKWIGDVIGDRRKWRREDRHRFSGERREAYAAFIAATQRIFDTDSLVEMTAAKTAVEIGPGRIRRRRLTSALTRAGRETMQDVTRDVEQMTKALAVIVLIAPRPVGRAAQRHVKAFRSQDERVRRDAYMEFLDLARRDLRPPRRLARLPYRVRPTWRRYGRRRVSDKPQAPGGK
jgi:hypothetical protein